jgi:signal peptidase I
VNFPRTKIGKQGRWPQALVLFFLPIFLIFGLRWFFYEPFVIPSESMVPNLYIHDHILVQKFAYGLKPPMGDGWLFKWSQPGRGDVIVFRYPENRDVFFIKRLIGLPGDIIRTKGMSLTVNGNIYSLDPYGGTGDFEEFNLQKKYIVRFDQESNFDQTEEREYIVPENSFFVMGDNRFNSHDSRFWGFVSQDLLVGKAQFIWLSCEETLVSMPFICNPATLRSERLFLGIY